MYVIKIEAVNNPVVVQCEKKLSLEFLQKAVDGNIETAPLRPCYSRLIPGILMIINENGKLHRHDFNGIATAIFNTAPKMSNPYEKLEAQMEPCPFCGKRMKFYRETHVNRFGHEVTSQYFMHADEEENVFTCCILDEIAMPFVIGAGDANIETGYIGEYATKWNNQINGNDPEMP